MTAGAVAKSRTQPRRLPPRLGVFVAKRKRPPRGTFMGAVATNVRPLRVEIGRAETVKPCVVLVASF